MPAGRRTWPPRTRGRVAALDIVDVLDEVAAPHVRPRSRAGPAARSPRPHGPFPLRRQPSSRLGMTNHLRRGDIVRSLEPSTSPARAVCHLFAADGATYAVCQRRCR